MQHPTRVFQVYSSRTDVRAELNEAILPVDRITIPAQILHLSSMHGLGDTRVLSDI